MIDFLFQSTRPMRGATVSFFSLCPLFSISIHAPHAGRDAVEHCIRAIRAGFQSTRPMRGATRVQ